MVGTSLAVAGQDRGRLTGVVHNSAGGPAAGITVVATNQVTSRSRRARSGPDGHYSLSLPEGAYRVAVALPQVARFDKDKNYGEFAIARGDTLENVSVASGKETTLDIQVEDAKNPPTTEVQTDKPIGFGGKESVPSTPQTAPDRHEVRDRWRIGFPEYDRYADHGGPGP